MSQSSTATLPTLAARAWSRRVQHLLAGVLDIATRDVEHGLENSVTEFEQQLFRNAEQARNNQVQMRWLEAQGLVRRSRADFLPRFMMGLEAELAGLREPSLQRLASGPVATRLASSLSLLDEPEMDESNVLVEMGYRAELRNSLGLYLMGQRFGVIAGRPAYDAESLPVGPPAMCRVLRYAAHCFEIDSEQKLPLFRAFDRNVLLLHGGLVESINAYLVQQGVLPNLQYVPLRVRPSAQPTAAPPVPALRVAGSDTAPGAAATAEAAAAGTAGAAGAAAAAPAGGESMRAPPLPPAQDPHQQAADRDFALMRELLAGRRTLLDKLGGSAASRTRAAEARAADPVDVQAVLDQLQHRPARAAAAGTPSPQRSISSLKQDLLAQLRQRSEDGEALRLRDEDNDTIELIGMLFDHLGKDVRPESQAAQLIHKLQVPLLRLALQDKAFFTRQQHPARQILNTIAETGAYWLHDDDTDRPLTRKMNAVVDRALSEYSGDPGLFNVLLEDLGGHMQLLARKADVAERRHVEAARGKERLALARDRAAAAVDELLAGQNLPRFTHTLLSQAWTDVMALTALRQGEDSEAWKQQLLTAGRLVSLARPGARPELAGDEIALLRQDVHHALSQVGYHEEEAAAIAQRLVDPNGGEIDDAASRTELLLRNKTRARLGEDRPPDEASKAPLSPEAQAWVEQLKRIPFGTWFDFVINEHGDKARRRLSWYSPVTAHMLFVNHRGQKAGEFRFEEIARQIVEGKVVMVDTTQKVSLIDRAFQAMFNALRSFAGRSDREAAAG